MNQENEHKDLINTCCGHSLWELLYRTCSTFTAHVVPILSTTEEIINKLQHTTSLTKTIQTFHQIKTHRNPDGEHKQFRHVYFSCNF